MVRKYITYIETGIHNQIIIYGKIGKKIYYYYSQRQAVRLYNKECMEKESECE